METSMLYRPKQVGTCAHAAAGGGHSEAHGREHSLSQSKVRTRYARGRGHRSRDRACKVSVSAQAISYHTMRHIRFAVSKNRCTGTQMQK